MLPVYKLIYYVWPLARLFIPMQAEARGASSVIVGAIISTYPTCVIIVSPILGYYVSLCMVSVRG